MYQFNYHKPQSLEDAVALFNEADDPMYLSGGMTLIPTMKQRLAAPTDLIDLSDIESMKGIDISDGLVSVGAFTRHNDIANSAANPGRAAGAGGCGGSDWRQSGAQSRHDWWFPGQFRSGRRLSRPR